MLYKAFIVTGLENKTVMDPGLISTVAEPKTILAVLVSVDQYQDNIVEGWIERERILEIPDRILDTHYKVGSDDAYQSTTKIIRIPIDEPILPGMIFMIGIKCAGTPSVLTGCYEYKITS
ncbi:hypothetical protein ES707_12473 [subsurface metagenome]